MRMEVEAKGNHGNIRDEQGNVEKEEDAANGVEARKPVWYYDVVSPTVTMDRSEAFTDLDIVRWQPLQ